MTAKKPFYQQVADKLIEQLQQGTAPWQKPWDGEGMPDHMPHNTITGRRYRGINNLWLLAQQRQDPRWMTYKQAAAIGAQVRKGEKGTVIEYWKFTEEINKTDEQGREIIGADGKPEKETVQLERPKVFHAVVFNAEQIDNLPPLEISPLAWDPDERAETILRNSGALIQHRAGDRAFYSLRTDSITLPLREQFADAGHYYAVALHELGHWTGHEARLNRDMAHPFGSEGYAREELRAEIASLMLSQDLGVSFHPEQHASYVESWIKALQDDPMEIMRAAADAEKIHAYVMELAQMQTVEQQQEESMGQTQQNIDEASLDAERQALQAVQDGSIAELVDTLVKEHRVSDLKQLDAIVATIEEGGRQGAFWQRHQPPADEAAFLVKLVEARTVLDDAAHQMAAEVESVAEQLQPFLPPQSDDETVKIVSDEKRYVQIPYADKNEAKALGARWDKEKKSWYIPPGVNQAPFEKWLNSPVNQAQAVNTTEPAADKILIDVPYREKNDARALGARWDKEQKSWYIPAGTNAALFARWMQAKPEVVAEEAAPDSMPQDAAVEQQAAAVQQERQAIRQQQGDQTLERVYLAVPYAERGAAKEQGARWDKANKSWYIASDHPNLSAVAKWLPENQALQSEPAMSPQEEFADKLRELGCVVEKGHPFMDGQKHRITTVGDKAGEKSGFYIAYLDGHPAGYVKNNRTGQEERWKAKGHSLSPAEKAKLAAESASKLQQREEQKRQAQEAAVGRIKHYMRGYQPVSEPTPYLQAKGIQPQPGIFTDRTGQKTYIPVYNIEGELRSMQYIQPDGTKRFAKDSQQEGCLHVVGGRDLQTASTIVLAEGYATAATINEATDETVACVAAFNSGNLPLVATELSRRYPEKQFLVAGDDDLAVQAKQGRNPGREKAMEAAAVLNCPAVLPVFAPGEQSADQKAFTDFNDLAQKSAFGREGVAKQIGEKIRAQAVTQTAQHDRKPPQPERGQVVAVKKRSGPRR